MKHFFYLILVFSCSDLLSQTPDIDSLKKVVEVAPNDTNKVKTLLVLTSKLESIGHNGEAMQYVKTSLSLSEELEYTWGIAVSHSSLGAIYAETGEHLNALDHLNLALPFYEQTGNRQEIGRTHNNLGMIFERITDYSRAVTEYTEALTIWDETGNKKEKAKTLSNMGVVYCKTHDYKSGFKHYTQALTLSQAIPDTGMIINQLLNIGSLYGQLGDTALAHQDTLAALDFYSQALNYFDMVLNLALLTGDTQGEIYAYYCLGIVNEAMDSTVTAKAYLEKSLMIAEKEGDLLSVAYAYAGLATVYLRLSDYALAEEYGLKSLAIAEKQDAFDVMMEVEKTLSEVYEKMNKGIEALTHYKNHVLIRDHIFSEKNIEENKDALAKYKYSAQMAERDQEIAAQRNTLGLALGLVIVISIASILFLFLLKRTRKEIRYNYRVTNEYDIASEKLTTVLNSILLNDGKLVENGSLPEEDAKHIKSSINHFLVSLKFYSERARQLISPVNRKGLKKVRTELQKSFTALEEQLSVGNSIAHRHIDAIEEAREYLRLALKGLSFRQGVKSLYQMQTQNFNVILITLQATAMFLMLGLNYYFQWTTIEPWTFYTWNSVTILMQFISLRVNKQPGS